MSNFESQLKAGNYEGEVVSQELLNSKTDKPHFEIKFGRLVHEDGTEVNPDVRRTVRLYLTDAALDFTIKKAASVGFSGSPSQFMLEDPDAISIIGNTAKLYMKIGEYGEDWDISTGGGASAGTAIDEVTAKQLDAKFGHKMLKGVPTTQPTAGSEPGF